MQVTLSDDVLFPACRFEAVDCSREPLWDKTHLCLREGGATVWQE